MILILNVLLLKILLKMFNPQITFMFRIYISIYMGEI